MAKTNKRAIITVRDLKKDYYQYKVFFRGKLLTKALSGISFDGHAGDFVGLIGVNGAGKSTLMRILTTNMGKTSGKVQVYGNDIERDQEKIKEDISWMFSQDYSGIGWASLEKNMALAASFIGIPDAEAKPRIDYLLKKFKLEDKRTNDVWRLSTGMLAKYSLAVALLKNPKILFLDEPLLGLDNYAKDEIRSILKELNDKGTTIIYTDHQLQEVEKICKRLLIINEGKLLFDGSVKKLKQMYRDTNVLDIVCTGKNINKTLYTLQKQHLFLDYTVLESEGQTHSIRLYTSIDSKQLLVRIAQALRRYKISVDQMNAGLLGLEDVYRKFLKVDSNEHKAQKLESFSKGGEDPLQEFEKLLEHTNPKIRSRACQLFWKKNRITVQPILLDMLSGSKEMQQEALHVIGQIKDKSFTKRVLEILDQQELLTKNYAIIALAKLGNETVLDDVVRLLLHHETIGFVLQHLPEFDKEFLARLQEKVQKISGYDKNFIRHHCLALKNSKKLLELLHLLHRDYKHWKREKFKKILN